MKVHTVHVLAEKCDTWTYKKKQFSLFGLVSSKVTVELFGPASMTLPLSRFQQIFCVQITQSVSIALMQFM